MRIEHIGLWAKDLEKTKKFYETHFEGKAGDKYVNPKTCFESYFIQFKSGARLEIMKKPSLIASGNDEKHLGYAHIAFSVGSKEKVDAVTETLRSEGSRVVSEPRVTGDGYYESCVLDPDGNKVEITE